MKTAKWTKRTNKTAAGRKSGATSTKPPKPAEPAPTKKPNAVNIVSGEDRATALAKAVLEPNVLAAVTLERFVKIDGEGPLETDALIAELGRQVQAVNDGDLRRAEAMLISQAHTLDAIFGSLARRAVAQHHLRQYEAHFHLALKAQAQCRATLQTLVEVKYPKQTQFVRQQNLALNQQVNNGPGGGEPRARTSEAKVTNELLTEGTNHERLGCDAPSATGDAHSKMAALEAVNRPEDARRQDPLANERL